MPCSRTQHRNSASCESPTSNPSIPGPEVIKLFSCSTQLSTKFQLLIKTKIRTNKEVSCFKSLRCIYHAKKCQNANNCWHFNIHEQDKFRAQLSSVWKKFYTSEPGLTLYKLRHSFPQCLQMPFLKTLLLALGAYDIIYGNLKVYIYIYSNII